MSQIFLIDRWEIADNDSGFIWIRQPDGLGTGVDKGIFIKSLESFLPKKDDIGTGGPGCGITLENVDDIEIVNCSFTSELHDWYIKGKKDGREELLKELKSWKVYKTGLK